MGMGQPGPVVSMAMLASLIIHLFSVYFFNRNYIFLAQQISHNSILVYFFNEVNEANANFRVNPYNLTSFD